MSDTKPLSEYSELEENEVVTDQCLLWSDSHILGKVYESMVSRFYIPDDPMKIIASKERVKIVAASSSRLEITLKAPEATAKHWFKPTSGPGGFALADALLAIEEPTPKDDLHERAKAYNAKRHEILGNLIEETAEAIKEAASREEPATEAVLFSQEAIDKSCEVLKRKLKKLGIRMTEEMIKETILEHVAEDAAESVAQAAAKAVEDFATNQCRKSKETDSSDKSIHVTLDEFEGPSILDDGRGDVRVTLSTRREIVRLYLFPKQAQSLYAALGVWSRKAAQTNHGESA